MKRVKDIPVIKWTFGDISTVRVHGEIEESIKRNSMNSVMMKMVELTEDEKEFLERVKPLIRKHLEMCKREGTELEEGSYVLSENGNIHHGVPFECAKGVHGEENAIGTMLTEEGQKSKLKIVLVVGGRNPVMPCGACRVAIHRYGVKDTTILCSNLSLSEMKKFTISELYPYPYQGKL